MEWIKIICMMKESHLFTLKWIAAENWLHVYRICSWKIHFCLLFVRRFSKYFLFILRLKSFSIIFYTIQHFTQSPMVPWVFFYCFLFSCGVAVVCFKIGKFTNHWSHWLWFHQKRFSSSLFFLRHKIISIIQ